MASKEVADLVEGAVLETVTRASSGFTMSSVSGPTPHLQTGGSVIELTCQEPGTARLSILVEDGVHCSFGRDTLVEWLISSSGGVDESVAHIEEIVGLVTNGTFEETLWLRRGKIVRSRTTVEQASGWLPTTLRNSHGIFGGYLRIPDERVRLTYREYA